MVDCTECQEPLDVEKYFFVREARDLKQPIWTFCRIDHWHITIGEGLLFLKGFNQASLRCLTSGEMTKVLKEVYLGVCGKNQWGSKLLIKFTWVLLAYHGGRRSFFLSKVPNMSA